MSRQVTRTPIDHSIILERDYPSIQDVSVALRGAAEAQKAWCELLLDVRCDIVARALGLVEQQTVLLADELTLQVGRPTRYAAKEIGGFVHRGRYMLSIAREALADDIVQPDTLFMTKEPLGTVLLVAAWNYPYLVVVNALVPALLAGNAVVLKHSPQAALVAERLVDIFAEAGVPPRVFQCLHLDWEATLQLATSPLVSGVNFTGSVQSGLALQARLGTRLVPLGLELGGCDAAYVSADCDLPWTAGELADGAYFNAGQSCCGVQRIYVDRSVYAHFLYHFKVAAERLRLGDPRDQETTLGPVIRPDAAERISRAIEDDKRSGALDIMDFAVAGPVQYMAPCALVNVTASHNILKDELFGPVVGIVPVQGADEAICEINSSQYGLTASIWTRSSTLVERFARRVDVGTVYANRCDVLDPALAWSGRKCSGRQATLSLHGFAPFYRLKSHNYK